MLRIGIIGAGPMGKGNAKQYGQMAGRCKITAVVDPDADARASIAAEYAARPADSLEDAFDDIDAAIISTPNFLHCDQAVACAKAGKHVFIEKPMALNVAEADRIVAAVEEAGVKSMVGFSVRFEGVMNTMNTMLANGEIGSPISLWSRRCMRWPADKKGTWRYRQELSGGLMLELMVHEIDWMVSAAGVPTSAYCRKYSRTHDHERDNEHLWMTLGFGDEVTGTIEGSRVADMSDFFRGIVGTKGALFTQQWGQELMHQQEGHDARAVEDLVPFKKHEHFLDVIDGKCSSVADVHHGRLITAIAQSLMDSAISGEVVRLKV